MDSKKDDHGTQLQLVPAKSQDLKPIHSQRPKKILSEDEFTEGISKIIERDFFSDLPKLKTQAEYFEALEKNDLVKLREIQMRFKRPDTAASEITQTPATFETPEGPTKATPATGSNAKPLADKPQSRTAATDLEEDLDTFQDIDSTAPKGRLDSFLAKNTSEDSASFAVILKESEQKRRMKHSWVYEKEMEQLSVNSTAPKGRLDSFLAKNTSEDSASFAVILKESEQKRRMKHSWVYEKEMEQLSEHNDMLALPSIEEQAVIKDRPDHLNTWKYVNANPVMYVPEGVDLSAKELIEMQKDKPRQIIHENTHFKFAPFNQLKSKEAMAKAASFKALINNGKIGHDGKEIQPGQSPNVNGYGFVQTPSPAPGVMDSPMMTWGEVDSTPARIDASDMPASTPGPIFRIPDVPKRDRLAYELSEKASKAHRAKKEEAIKQVTRRFASPSPSAKINLSPAERISSMSPAAQKLASKRLGIRRTTDKALQESYSPSPSPSHRYPGTKTPTRLTPSSKRSNSSRSGTPSASPSTPGSQRNASSSSSLTDHLLHLPKRKRQSAEDFF